MINWKNAQGYRINRMITLTSEMLTPTGESLILTKTVKGKQIEGIINFDREYVLDRLGDVLLVDLKLSLESAISLITEVFSYKTAVLEDKKNKELQELIERYGIDSVISSLS